jgi:hypothetical protein
MTLNESFPEVWNAIETKSISKSKINEYLLNVLLEIIEDIKQNKRNELDIGDIFGLAIQHAEGAKEYKLTPEVEDFFCKLGSYKDDPFNSGEYNPEDTPEKVEKEAKKLLESIKVNSN